MATQKRQKIGFQDQILLNAGQKYCRMLQGDIFDLHLGLASLKLSCMDAELVFKLPIFCLVFLKLFNYSHQGPHSLEKHISMKIS